jgi:hypothetical protein
MITAIGFEGLAVPTVLPATLAQFGGLPLYGWAFSGFWLSALVGITLSGVEADRRGPRGPMAVGALLFAAGLLVTGLASGMEWVVAGRVLQGFGAGAIASIVYVVTARGYDRAAQPRMIAVISSAWVVCRGWWDRPWPLRVRQRVRPVPNGSPWPGTTTSVSARMRCRLTSSAAWSSASGSTSGVRSACHQA